MKKFFTLIAVAAMAFAAQANELTVCDNGVVGEDAWGSIPVYGYWFDAEGMTQQIYPAEMLTEMAGGKINSLTFYTAATWGEGYEDYAIAFDGSEILLSLKEVDQTAFDEEDPMIGGATVVAHAEAVAGGLYLTFELDEPFEYNGGNLLVEAYWSGEGTWGRTYFVGEETDQNTAYCGFDYYGEWTESVFGVLNKVTFNYEAGEAPVDPEEPYMTGYWLVQVNANGEKIYTELFPGQNGDFINVDDITYPEFRDICAFYFLINGEAYGANEDMTEAFLGDADQNPLTPGENRYFVGVGYSYTFGVHLIFDQNTMEFMGYSAYVAKGGPVDVDEINAGKAVAGVRYFNMAGQEMQEANGMTIVVTTYTDGTTSTAKVIK